MAFTPYEPAQSTNLTFTHRVLISRLGDGYVQRHADGINNTTAAGTISWVLNRAKGQEQLAFLYALKGVQSFSWILPTETVARKFIVHSINPGWMGSHYEIQAEVEQIFEN